MARCLGEKTIREGVHYVQGTAILEKQSRPGDSFHPLVLLKTWNVQGSPSKPHMNELRLGNSAGSPRASS